MRLRGVLLWLSTASALAGDVDSVIVGPTWLSAQPPALAVGRAGPFNRVAFDVEGLPGESVQEVVCTYPRRLVYLCNASLDDAVPAGSRRRLTVTIPDLGYGSPVTVRIVDARGTHDIAVELANTPQVVHEIEALPLPSGGKTWVGGDGRLAPVMQMASDRATTTPAMATSTLGAAPACDQIHAEWVGTSATDPVFTSDFGPLNGSVVLARPVARGSRVRSDNLPEWLVSYPLGATRVQFIAHYEVMYRVGTCPQRVVRNQSP